MSDLEDIVAVASDGAIQPALIRHHVVGMTTVKLGDSQHEVFPTVDEVRFDLIEVHLNLGTSRDNIVE